MRRWLLAAEADRIQDFVFRSSRLVEVVGGSAVLERFCKQVPCELMRRRLGRLPDPMDVVISAGGAFRLAFDDANVARTVGRDLAEAYLRETGGTLTVVEPHLCVTEGGEPSFGDASRHAEAELRRRKADRRGEATACAQTPYAALCASCGVEVAAEFARRHANEKERYLCRSCVRRAAERDTITDAAFGDGFLRRFLDAVRHACPGVERTPDHEMLPADADVVGDYDAKGYVAYLLADGNASGSLFDGCRHPATMQRLSAELDATMLEALVAATVPLASRLAATTAKRNGSTVPVLPLIVAGDDLYALLPASYAIDFARRVCLAFESRLGAVVADLGVQPGARPTMSAALVVCKKSYPYALAHRHGELLLRHAKALARAAKRDGLGLSTLSFAVVLGGELVAEETLGRQYLIPSACPYSVSAGDGSPDSAKYAVDAVELLDARWGLRDLPGKRRAELRRLFEVDLPSENGGPEAVFEKLSREWAPRLQRFVKRATATAGQPSTLAEVLQRLGGRERFGWRGFEGRTGRTGFRRWSAVPDLLEFWDFAMNLDRGPEEYEERT